MHLIRVPERKKKKKNIENDRQLVFEEIVAEDYLELIKNRSIDTRKHSLY